MLTVTILINGQPLYTRSCYREYEHKNGIYEYRVDDGSIIKHYYDDGAVVLAQKLLDTIKPLERNQKKREKEKIEKLVEIINGKSGDCKKC